MKPRQPTHEATQPLQVLRVRNGPPVYGRPDHEALPKIDGVKLVKQTEEEDDLAMVRRNGVIK